MNEWREESIAELCSRTLSGGTPTRSKSEYFCPSPHGLPWIKSQELTDRRIGSAQEHITELGLKHSSAKIVPPNSVLVAMYGATVGQVGYLSIEATTNQAICALLANPHKADSRFLFYALRHAKPSLIARAHGAAQQNLSQERIRMFKLKVPQLPLQRRISEILSALDDLIENNRRRVELLERMAEAIYREWFVHFRYPGHEAVPLVDSPLGLIPENWDVKSFLAVARFVNGFAFKPSHWGSVGRPIIKIRELKQGVTADTPRCDLNQVDAKYWVEPGDLLFSWSADLGVYRWFNEPGLLNQHLFKVTPTGDLSLAFLKQALHQAVDRFWHRAQGTTMRHIKRSALSEVSTVVPPRHIDIRFADLTEPMIRDAMVLHQSNRWLASIRDLLLPKLVTGQIDVSALDLDALVGSAT